MNMHDYNQVLASYRGHLSYGNTNGLIRRNIGNNGVVIRYHWVLLKANGEVVYLED